MFIWSIQIWPSDPFRVDSMGGTWRSAICWAWHHPPQSCSLSGKICCDSDRKPYRKFIEIWLDTTFFFSSHEKNLAKVWTSRHSSVQIPKTEVISLLQLEASLPRPQRVVDHPRSPARRDLREHIACAIWKPQDRPSSAQFKIPKANCYINVLCK